MSQSSLLPCTSVCTAEGCLKSNSYRWHEARRHTARAHPARLIHSSHPKCKLREYKMLECSFFILQDSSRLDTLSLLTLPALTRAPGAWRGRELQLLTNIFILKNSGKFPDQEGALYGLQSVLEPVIWCMLHFSSQSFIQKLSLGIFHLCTEEANICLGTLFGLYI